MGKFFTILVITLITLFTVGTSHKLPSHQNFSTAETIYTLAGPTDNNLIELLDDSDAVVIQLGLGGRVNGMLDTLQYLRNHPSKTIVIDGECYSACTMLLSAPDNVLLTDNARMFFHSGTETVCDDGLEVQRLSPSANQKMLKLFSATQRAWIINTNAYSSVRFTEMPRGLVYVLYRDMWISTDEMPKRMDTGIDTSEEPKPKRPEPCGWLFIPTL
ncbi:hypothetical protein D3C87_796320 [compost metagenome]